MIDELLVVKGIPSFWKKMVHNAGKSGRIMNLETVKIYSPNEFVMGRLRELNGSIVQLEDSFMRDDAQVLLMYQEGLKSGKYEEIGRISGESAIQIKEFAFEYLELQKSLVSLHKTLYGNSLAALRTSEIPLADFKI